MEQVAIGAATFFSSWIGIAVTGVCGLVCWKLRGADFAFAKGTGYAAGSISAFYLCVLAGFQAVFTNVWVAVLLCVLPVVVFVLSNLIFYRSLVLSITVPSLLCRLFSTLFSISITIKAISFIPLGDYGEIGQYSWGRMCLVLIAGGGGLLIRHTIIMFSHSSEHELLLKKLDHKHDADKKLFRGEWTAEEYEAYLAEKYAEEDRLEEERIADDPYQEEEEAPVEEPSVSFEEMFNLGPDIPTTITDRHGDRYTKTSTGGSGGVGEIFNHRGEKVGNVRNDYGIFGQYDDDTGKDYYDD